MSNDSEPQFFHSAFLPFILLQDIAVKIPKEQHEARCGSMGR